MRAVRTAAMVASLWIATMPRPCGAEDLAQRLTKICVTESDNPLALERLFREVQATGEKGRRALLKLASSQAPERECAIGYLVRLDDRRVVPIARTVLADKRSPETAIQAALDAVAFFRDLSSFDNAVSAFRSKNRNIVTTAAAALGSLGEPDGVRMLRDALTDPAYAEVRIAVVTALGTARDKDAVDPLLALSKDRSYARF